MDNVLKYGKTTMAAGGCTLVSVAFSEVKRVLLW